MMRRTLATLAISLCIAGLSLADEAGAVTRKKPLTLKELERLIDPSKPRKTTGKKATKPQKKTVRKAPAKKATPTAKAPVKPEPKPETKEAAEPAEAPVKPIPKPQIAKTEDAPVKPVDKPVIPPPVLKAEEPPKPDVPPAQQQAGLSQPGPVNLPPGDTAQACLDDLKQLGVEFTTPVQLVKSGDCDVDNPVQLMAVTGNGLRVSFPDKPTLRCTFARTFASWASDVAAPIVKKQTGSDLSSLPTGPGYECRGRAGDSASAKTSEHGFGNAVDIESVVTADKKRVGIKEMVPNEADPNYRMLQALRLSGCGYFTTVLGPGSNAAHATHFHFDLAQRGKNNNYKICE